MPDFPSWKRTNVGFPEAVQLGRSQLGRVVSDLRAGAGLATRAVPTRAVEIAEQTRGRFEQLPGVVLGELRRRVNLLDLATKQDVAAQSKLGRNRVSFVLKEFLEAQRDHDEALLESLRSELREELQSFAAAVDDNLFAIDEQPPSTDLGAPRRPPADLDYLPDDEIELEDYDAIGSTDDDDDLMGDEVTIRKRGSR